MNFCIEVPSHIKTAIQINSLIVCLRSLIDQDEPIDILVSVSFEEAFLCKIFKMKYKKSKLNNEPLIILSLQKKKMSEFKHIELLSIHACQKYNYVMFCRDQDRYEKNRTKIFIETLKENDINDKPYAGAFEQIEKSHLNEIFHVYARCCVHVDMIYCFFCLLSQRDAREFICNEHCFLLFSTFIAHRSCTNKFLPITNQTLYIKDGEPFMVDESKLPPLELTKLRLMNICTFRIGDVTDIIDKFCDTKENKEICHEYAKKLISTCDELFVH